MADRADSTHPTSGDRVLSYDPHHTRPPVPSGAVMVDVASLVLDGSPRLEGENEDHVQTLVEIGEQLPPILVHRESMRVLDGLHRVHAARLRGLARIAAVYFDGDDRAAFVKAVEANISHGLPLSLADRRAAAQRIVSSYPEWSDRAVAAVAGLSTRAVRTLRAHRSTDAAAQLNARVGQDGRTRPLNAAVGRRRAAEVIAEHPDAVLREIASVAGVSLATARDVRIRLRNGEDPVPSRARATAAGGPAAATHQPLTVRGTANRRQPSQLLQRLKKDPALRYSERGRHVLRWLDTRIVEAADWSRLTESLPPHCAYTLAELATACAQAWQQLAAELRSPGNDQE